MILMAVVGGSSVSFRSDLHAQERPRAVVAATEEAMRIDGILDEASWQRAVLGSYWQHKDQTSTLFIPSDLKNVGALLMLIIVLLVRPQGLFGRAERIG